MEFLVDKLIMLIELIEYSIFNLNTFFSLDIVMSNKTATQSANLINQSTIQLNQPLRFKHLLHFIGVIAIPVINDQRRCNFETRIPTFYSFDKNQLGL